MALREGDLLFHVAEKNNAITEVTPGMIDHVAIVIGADSVIEAVGKGVVTTPLDSLLSQSGRYVATTTSIARSSFSSPLSTARDNASFNRFRCRSTTTKDRSPTTGKPSTRATTWKFLKDGPAQILVVSAKVRKLKSLENSFNNKT